MDNHGCTKCFEVNKGYHTVKNGQKVCDLCGGKVLDLQEAFDKIAELTSDIEFLKELP